MPTYCDPWPGNTYASFWASRPVSSAVATLTVTPGSALWCARRDRFCADQCPCGPPGASADQYIQHRSGLEAFRADRYVRGCEELTTELCSSSARHRHPCQP